jgi:hypothetical protein
MPTKEEVKKENGSRETFKIRVPLLKTEAPDMVLVTGTASNWYTAINGLSDTCCTCESSSN